MKDNELLALVQAECRNSVGFEYDATLVDERERALRFSKGDFSKDIKTLPGRSNVTSTLVADAIEMVLPDLVEIFTTEDALAFMPNSEEDEDAAQQETDYTNHVLFEQNNGFLILYTAIKDALQVKTGIFKWYAEDCEDEEHFKDQGYDAFVVAFSQYPENIEVISGDVMDPSALFEYKITRKWQKPVVEAVPPEDFAVSVDTVRLKDTPYCVHRSRPRIDALMHRGIPESMIRDLPTYGVQDTQMEDARDTAGEHNNAPSGVLKNRRVEVREHFIRVHGKYKRVLTDASMMLLLEQEDVDEVCFAAFTPYPVTHRFYGLSMADKLIEIAKIKTTLQRMLLDSGFFALNQRNQVDMNYANEFTLPDLLNNAPNVPIRTDGPAVTPIGSAGLSFDAMGAMEFFHVEAEQRTGVVRNAQGLNPDTLHDTATGAIALMSESQKRVRMMARVMAEFGIKDMMLGLHGLIRKTAQGPMKARLRGKWVETDPTAWGNRMDMTIEIGAGAGGQDAELSRLTQLIDVMNTVVTTQGNPNGPLVDMNNVYNALKRYIERGLRFKTASPFIKNPDEQEPQEPQPDPAMMEAQAQMQIEQQKIEAQQMRDQAQIETDRMKAAAQIETDRMKAMASMELQRENNAAKMKMEREQAAQQSQLAMEKAQFEARLATEKARFEAQLAQERAALDARLAVVSADAVAISKNRPGGDLDK